MVTRLVGLGREPGSPWRRTSINSGLQLVVLGSGEAAYELLSELAARNPGTVGVKGASGCKEAGFLHGLQEIKAHPKRGGGLTRSLLRL